MDVVFLENETYFNQTDLQGKEESKEYQFWHTSIPMPTMFFPTESNIDI